MIEYPSRKEAVFAAFAGITGVAGSYAVAGYTRSFVVAPIDDLVVRATPGVIVSWVIQNIGDEGHYLHIALSIAIAIGLLGATALGGILVARRLDRPFVGIGLVGLASWALTVGITGEPVLAIGAAVPATVFAAAGSTPSIAEPDASRRRVLGASATAIGFTGLALGAGKTFSRSSVEIGDTVPGTEGEQGDEVSYSAEELLAEAERAELDIAGEDVPGLVSPIGEFYNVDIAEFEPEVPADEWSLTITGEVGTDTTITFEELTERPVENRFTTLRCVGEDRNERKMDNAIWTGTPIGPLLEEVDPDGECGCVMLRGEDGYYVQFPVEALEDGFIAWGMNGEPLPQSHGHPVRVLVPGHWGETNVKWLNEIELLDEEVDGYWEERGWQGTGPVNTVAKLWDDTVLDDGRIEVAGHAYAGTRGIERVEVSTDGGDSWNDAELSDPLPGDDVWRQWRYVFEPDGSHEVVVRAVDGEGNLQTEERSSSKPSGATGWVSQTIEA
ncbi:molybdopterin-binding oxidoreductase [Halobacteriales archaeon QH_2_65_14]|nr:MAG: molybdopterin-binding oxidoreductase [Halobacteriales archaeon QH_2_65_14]